jgi:hypothetical protein
MFFAITLQSCSNAGPARADHEDLRTEVDLQGFSLDKLSVKSWKGIGSGGVTTEFSGTIPGPVYYAEGKGNDAQTVIVSGKLNVKLHSGHYYELSSEVCSRGVVNYFDFLAALRTGKNRDVFEKYDGNDTWSTKALLLNPGEDVIPEYFAIRLYGQGRVFARPFYLRELTRGEFEEKKKALAAEKTLLNQKRLEKVFRAYIPSLTALTNDSPTQFKIWGATEDSFPPAPFGWRQVPGEQPVLDNAVTFGLKNAEYLIYTRPAATPVYLESLPRANELTSKLSAFGAPGQYVPLNFAVYTAKSLEGIQVRVSDLKSDKGEIIKSSNIDVRTVNFARKIKDNNLKTYYLLPLTLGKGPDIIEEKTSRRYWLTVLVPSTAKPGIYHGTIHFEPRNNSSVKIPVEFNVLRFTLLDPPIVRFMWGPPKSNFPDNEYKMYQDMAAHGLSTMMLGGEVKTRDQKVGAEDIDNIAQSIDRSLVSYHKVGFRDLPIGGISNNQINCFWDKSINWFRFWPITPELDKQFLSAYQGVFIQGERSKNRSNLLHYVVDEPGGANPKNLEPAQHYLKLLKKELPQLKTFVTIGGGLKQGYDEIGMLSPYLDVTCTNYATKDVIDRLEKLHSDFWIYNGSSLNIEPIKERFFFGWYAWKIGAKGIGQWTYAWAGNPFSSVFRDDRQDYGLETKGGYLPTVGLEMIREGIDDYRYLYTLSKLIQHGLKSRDEILNQKARNAASLLAAIRDKINLNYLRGADVPESQVVGITAGNLDSFREELALLSTELVAASKSSWPGLQAELKQEPEIASLKPSQRDWQSSAPLQATGKDLLSKVNFGGIRSDWKVQIWKGKGGGNFDTGVTYQGRRSAQLFIASDSKDDNSALVLNNPDLLLKKGIRYRLSTWIKTENVTHNVLLFAAVRSGGVSDVGSQKLKGNSDWKWVYLEFTPEEDCRAQYFAVRLWGPGTVYIDRITLQAL